MGISHDYHSTGRSRRGGPGGAIRFAGAVAGILMVSFAITAILEHGQAQPEELPTVTANGTAQNILAPLPMQGAADSTTDSAVKSSVRGEEVALDVLAAAQPKKLYILLGTNTLTTVGAADRFLAYYGQMLDVLRQTLGEDCVIYVESIPPVRPKAAAEKPGLASDIIRSVNEQLALLAADKGCVYLDLWETLADGEGNLKEVLAAPDGVHFSAGNGYGAWVTYLRNHAKYSADNAWTPGSAYAG